MGSLWGSFDSDCIPYSHSVFERHSRREIGDPHESGTRRSVGVSRDLNDEANRARKQRNGRTRLIAHSTTTREVGFQRGARQMNRNSPRPDLNRRPMLYESIALPAELLGRHPVHGATGGKGQLRARVDQPQTIARPRGLGNCGAPEIDDEGATIRADSCAIRFAPEGYGEGKVWIGFACADRVEWEVRPHPSFLHFLPPLSHK